MAPTRHLIVNVRFLALAMMTILMMITMTTQIVAAIKTEATSLTAARSEILNDFLAFVKTPSGAIPYPYSVGQIKTWGAIVVGAEEWEV